MSQSLVLMHTGKRGKWIMYQWSLTQAKSCWRSYWTDWSHRQRRSSLKTRQASEQAGTSQSRSSTYESSVRNIASTSKTSTMSSQTSRRPSTGFGMQLCGQPWRSTTSVPTLSESSKTSDKATCAVLFNSSIGDWLQTTVGVGYKQQLESDRDVCSHPPTHEGTVSIGGRTVTNLHFTDDIWWLSRRVRRTGKISWASWQSLHSL